MALVDHSSVRRPDSLNEQENLLVLLASPSLRPRRSILRSALLAIRAAPWRRRRSRASARYPVEIATAVKKKAPVRLDALGTVTPMASVAIKSQDRQRNRWYPFRGRRAGQAGRRPDHARQAQSSKRKSRLPKALSRAIRRNSKAPSAMCGATPISFQRTPRR